MLAYNSCNPANEDKVAKKVKGDNIEQTEPPFNDAVIKQNDSMKIAKERNYQKYMDSLNNV
jgi:hypothetical protein